MRYNYDESRDVTTPAYDKERCVAGFIGLAIGFVYDMK